MSIKATDDFDFEKWKRRRKLTMIGFFVVGVVLGMEYAVTFTTLWLYLKTLVKPSKPYIFYSFISAAYYVMTIIASLIVSRIVDKYRCVRASFLVCTSIVAVGNIMYSLPFSPFLLLFGRLISGIGGSMRPIMSGEVARCYGEDEKIGAFSALGIAFNLGFIIGPGINFVFVNVNFTVGKLHVTYASVPGFFMALVFSAVLVMEYFLIYDLSKEYDLKSNTVNDNNYAKENNIKDTQDCSQNRNRADNFMITSVEGRSGTYALSFEDLNQNDNQPLVQTKNGPIGYLDTTLRLLTNIDVAIICFGSSLVIFSINIFDLWLPLLVVDVLHWGTVEVNAITFATGVGTVAVMLFLWKYSLTQRKLFFISLVGIFLLTIMLGSIICLRLYNKNLILNAFNWTLYCLFLGSVMIADDIFFVSTLARMVPTENQSFAESVRQFFTRVGSLVALLASGILFKWIVEVCFVMLALVFLTLLAIMLRKKHFLTPKLLF